MRRHPAPPTRVRVLVVLVLTLIGCAAAEAQFQITSVDGRSSLKLGVLLQPQGEWIETADAQHWSQNLFLRRARLLVGGTVDDHLSFFFDTDSPNLGKSGHKNDLSIFVQDAFVTWSEGDAFKVDAGMILLPLDHNHMQSAGTLLPVDYGPFTFAESGYMQEQVGRDYGVQLRGYVLGQHLEYRVGAFQGVRNDVTEPATTTDRNPFRTVARIVWYPFEADTGYFYSGTFLGTKKVAALGASYDTQGSYKLWSVDAFWDWPAAGGDVFTVQADWTSADPDPAFEPADPTKQLYQQRNWLFEAGYGFHGPKLEPFVQIAGVNYADEIHPDESRYRAGVAWWGSGHKFNVKLAGGKIRKEGTNSRDEIVLQMQVFAF